MQKRKFNAKHRWGVILAGGEGTRLRMLTRLASGDDRPKQFCRLLGGRTLLEQTQHRIRREISPQHTLYVLLTSHAPFYGEDLRGVRLEQRIVQSSNRGTLPAILCSLMHILREDPEATVALFPLDHDYADNKRFMTGVKLAFETAEANPESAILLAAPAKHAEAGYGWIEAKAALSTESRSGLLKIKHFWEKPSPRVAQDLFDRGCVWNTFVMVGRVTAFAALIRAREPELFRTFEQLLTVSDREAAAQIMRTIYHFIPESDFSQSILTTASDNVSILCLGDVGWTDLDDPSRVITTLSKKGVRKEWAGQWQQAHAAAAC